MDNMAWTSAEDQKLLSYLSTSIMAMAGHEQIAGSSESIQHSQILAPALHVDDVEKALQLEPLVGQVFDHQDLAPTLHVDDVRKALQIEPLVGPVNVPEFSPPLHGEKSSQAAPLGQMVSAVYDTTSVKSGEESQTLVDPPVGEIDGEKLAKPLHVQKVERAIRLQPLMTYINDLLRRDKPVFWPSDDEEEVDIIESDTSLFDSPTEADGTKIMHGIKVTKDERRADKSRLYNFNKLRKNRKWLKNVLLSDSSSDENEDLSAILSDEYIRQMKKVHKLTKRHKTRFGMLKENRQYKFYSSSLLSAVDHFADHQKSVVGVKKYKASREHRREKKKLSRLKKLKRDYGDDYEDYVDLDDESLYKRKKRRQRLSLEEAVTRQKLLWAAVCGDVAKASKQRLTARKDVLANLKKVSTQCIKEARRFALQSQRLLKASMARDRRISRRVLARWHRFVKTKKEIREKEEKEAEDRRRIESSVMESRRHERKVNFLITQTELYAHILARKVTGEGADVQEQILGHFDEMTPRDEVLDSQGHVIVVHDDYDSSKVKQTALRNVEASLDSHNLKTGKFDDGSTSVDTDGSVERHQPNLFYGVLKSFQLKGMNWLCKFYDHGINGILADEIGLGKTMQTLAFLAHLAETKNIWGPFLIVAPASKLHKWTQECARFVPKLKCMPYWGNTQDRKILRKFWNCSNIHSVNAPFHLILTSYQLIMQDLKYFKRINWHYMVLDEEPSMKTSSSMRWKVLMTFNSRNRLLLTDNPLQNSMTELWSLLRFIMPTLFDSDEEFKDWLSQDVQSQEDNKSNIHQNDPSRLNLILRPFMLRRVKKDVENELHDKIEIMMNCQLTTRQRQLYHSVKDRISLEDLLMTSSLSRHSSPNQSQANNLMNLVMQLRKVCNHPELYERRDIQSSLFVPSMTYHLPRLVYTEGLLETSMCTSGRRHLLYTRLSIHHPHHVHNSLSSNRSGSVKSCFSFLRFIDMSPMEMYRTMMAGLLYRWLSLRQWWKIAHTIRHVTSWSSKPTCVTNSFLHRKLLLLSPLTVTSASNISVSSVLNHVIFTSHVMTSHGHVDHVIKAMPETSWHRRIRLRSILVTDESQPTSPAKSTPVSPQKARVGRPSSSTRSANPSPTKLTRPNPDPEPGSTDLVHTHVLRPVIRRQCVLSVSPPFLYYHTPTVHCPEREVFCADRSAAYARLYELNCGSSAAGRSALLYGCQELSDLQERRNELIMYSEVAGMEAVQPLHGFSGVLLPDKDSLITGAGKLHVLDSLLIKLKSGGHRVLIYSQMTRMIDILEEFMWHRRHTYMRLDGSSKISERRDMMADFQTRADVFVFLLSTRAGGLGINLTAADTVIFYDSDWNPRVDEEAMDRAHRLGQTKQVTVYRLLCKGTIEERILKRAQEKREKHRVVISGGEFKSDSLKPREVVSLLLDDEEMRKKFLQKEKEMNSGGDRDPFRRRRKKEAKRRRLEACDSSAGPGFVGAGDSESVRSFESGATSPVSVGSESVTFQFYNDSSNDALVIADDTASNVSGPSMKRSRARTAGKSTSGSAKLIPGPAKWPRHGPGLLMKGPSSTPLSGIPATVVHAPQSERSASLRPRIMSSSEPRSENPDV